MRQRNRGAKLSLYESRGDLVRLVIAKEGEPTREVSINGRAFDLRDGMSRAFLALALSYEMGINDTGGMGPVGDLANSKLFDELAQRAATGFEISLEPIAEWALAERAAPSPYGSEPPNPFTLTIEQLRAANRNKTFSAVAQERPGVGEVVVSVDGMPARRLVMPVDSDGMEFSTGFGWGYSGQGARALTIAMFMELGLGRREALEMVSNSRVVNTLDENRWTVRAGKLVDEVARTRTALSRDRDRNGGSIALY